MKQLFVDSTILSPVEQSMRTCKQCEQLEKSSVAN